MDLTHVSPAAAAIPESQGESPIMELFDVMSQLKDVLIAENDLLDIGLPAALSDLTDIKTLLAEDFQELSTEMLSEHAGEIVANPALGHRLVEAGMELRTLTQANMERLSSALDATRRRIESVMMAIHEQDQESRTYARRPAKGLTIAANYIEYAVNYKV